MPSPAQPTLVHLPDRLKTSLQQLVSQTGKPEAELIGEAIEAYLESQNRPLPRSIGIGASDRGDLSDRVDDLLWQDS
jgi:predicted transcriptional regulator